MANVDAKLKVAELDFDTIKTNLKDFLKSQSEFSDYNFEGSGMSVLLDILAYNTHYMGYYLNMVANEMFLDTAINRGSVVSHAKLLGYTPRSRVAARSALNLTITPVANDSNSSIVIPRFVRFVSETKDGVNYIFVTPSSRIVTKNATTGLFVAENLEIKEGQPSTISFVYDSTNNPTQTFEIPDVGVDTSTIQVAVQKSGQNANLETFILAQDATAVNEAAPVYYLEENKNGRYQIYFGDDVIGKKLTDGNIVIISYIVTNGINANGLSSFKLLDTFLNGSTVTITTVSSSSSGAPEENIDNIRFTAPKAYISQNRAVTKNDYIALINRDYPYFEAVNVWGGEENDPPVYGKVFFTAKPLGGYEITTTETEFVKNTILKPFSVLTVTPEYVEADYNYVNLSVDVNYDPTKTNKTADEVGVSIRNAIINFCNQNLDTFNSSFKISQLSRAIDDSESSITSNDVDVILEKRFAPDTTRSLSYTLNFGTELAQGTTTERLVSYPSFGYFDSSGIERNCQIEEVLQSFTGVESIDVVTPGNDYVTTPEVVIEGDGFGAEARALIVNGSLKKVEIVKQGTGYTSARATITGGGGAGATVRANLQGRFGKLRIYYFDSNQIKKTITEDVGTIDYRLGTITLNNFSPTSIDDPFGTMIIKVIPRRKIFSSVRNRIITLDQSDPAAIKVTINAVVES
jgi:hypothetical protein